MIEAYKYRIYPNINQTIQLSKTFGCNRLLYNTMLEEHIKTYESLKDNKAALRAHNYKTEKEIKTNFEFMKEVDGVSLQQSRLNLEQAYKNFFRRCKKGKEAPGYPKFKRKTNDQSYRTINNNNTIKVDFENKTIRIPKVGLVKYRDDREFKGKIKSITISKNTSNEYYCSILVDTKRECKSKIKIENINKTIALDMSAHSFAISEDNQFTNPKFYRNIEDKLKYLHRALSRKQKQSNNKAKARLKLAKFYRKFVNKKTDWTHKLSKSIVDNYDAIFVENLNIKEMQQFSSGLSKTVTLDFSWAEFVRQLEYKSKWYGKHLVKVGRFFPSSQLCFDCGYQNHELTLNDRSWVCPDCGVIHDRDINASKNIKSEGMKILINTVGTTEINACKDMSISMDDSVQESMTFTS